MNILLGIIILSIILILAWLFLSGREKIDESAQKEATPDRILRRRSMDKEIEKEFTPGFSRRQSDIRPEDKRKHNRAAFKLPNLADEIIPEHSRFKIYKQILINAQNFASRGEFITAISLYEGVRYRIKDPDIAFKIDENIEYLKDFKIHQVIDKEEEKEKSPAVQEVKLSVDGKLPQTINVSVVDPEKILASEDFAEKVSARLREEIDRFRDSLPAEFIRPDTPREESADLTAGVPEEEVQTEEQAAEVQFSPPAETEVPEIDTLADDEIKILHDYEDDFGESAAADDEVFGSDDDEKLKELINEMSLIKSRVSELSEEKEKLSSELEKIRGSGGSSGTAEISIIQNELGRLSGHIDTLSQEKARTSAELGLISGSDSADVQSALMTELENMKREIRGLHNEKERMLEKMENIQNQQDIVRDNQIDERFLQMQEKIDDISSFRPGRELAAVSAGAPSLIEARFDSPPPATSRAVEPGQRSAPGGLSDDDFIMPSAPDSASESSKPLTDDDIFEKILNEGGRPSYGKDDFEIRGENRDDTWGDISVEDFELKKSAEEKFYRSFLEKDTRVKKELPVLKVTYDFTKLPDEYSLSKDKNILEYAFYKYKPMLQKANGFIKERRVRDAVNYYKVVVDQNIPSEIRSMINKNIADLTEYLEKYMTAD